MSKTKKHWNKIYDAKPKKGDGKQRHFRGKMVLPSGSPRAHTHGGNSRSEAGWTCGDTARPAAIMRETKGEFKVGMPTKRSHRRGIVRNATTGAQVGT